MESKQEENKRMKEEQRELVRKYPYSLRLFFRKRGGMSAAIKDKEPFHGCEYWGFECGGGWNELLDECLAVHEKELFDWLQRLTPEDRKKCDQYYGGPPAVRQIKEKYGTLRFYTDFSTPAVGQAVEIAEAKSAITCESCGDAGKLRGTGWLQTLCDDCAK